MNRKLFELWFLKLGKAWKEKNPKAIPPIFRMWWVAKE